MAHARLGGEWVSGNVFSVAMALGQYLAGQSPALQFKAEAHACYFDVVAMKRIEGTWYARIRLHAVHGDGHPREFLISFATSGDFYGNGFEVYAAFTTSAIPNADQNHWYSTIDTTPDINNKIKMDEVWAKIVAGTFKPDDFTHATFAGCDYAFYDLIDPPSVNP